MQIEAENAIVTKFKDVNLIVHAINPWELKNANVKIWCILKYSCDLFFWS